MEDKHVQTEGVLYPNLTTERMLILDMQQKMNQLTRFMYESAHEHRKNYAAINAQLHMINERLRSSDSMTGSSSSVSSNIKMKKELLRCISKDKLKKQEGNDDLSGSETIHRDCLLEKLQDMVKDMDLVNTNLMDELLDIECLTQDEASDITHTGSRKDQIRKLIVLFARRGRGNFIKFLEVIGREHQFPHIARELREIYVQKITEGRSSECLLCVIKRDVDIRDIVDQLCNHKVVDIEFLDLLVSTKSGNQNSLWEIIFSNIDKSANRKQHICYLQEALSKKYERLASKLGLSIPPQLGNHICSASRSFNASWRSVGSIESSIGDGSTTSEVPRKSDSEELTKYLPPVPNATNIPHCISWLNSIDPTSSDNSSPTDDVEHSLVSPVSGDSGVESGENGKKSEAKENNSNT